MGGNDEEVDEGGRTSVIPIVLLTSTPAITSILALGSPVGHAS